MNNTNVFSFLEQIKALGRDEQPAIRPEEKGFYRWLDPYLSTSRGTHVPFTKDQQDGVARKDIITFYDIANYPKVPIIGYVEIDLTFILVLS